jgi:hypothetical protein
VIYGRSFFDLQFELAETVSTLSGQSLGSALLEYTNFYIRFGLGRGFDLAHPGWQEYLAGLRDTDDGRAFTYRFYASRPPGVGAPDVVATFGCFSYARLGPDRLRLHFENAEQGPVSPLGAERRDQRLADLTALFEHVKRTAREPPRVVGASWLYNLDAYRRLFPPSYLATARAIHHRFQHMPLWGQFVNRHGELKESMARQLRERLGRQATLEQLDQCFPFQVLRLEASAHEFYDFYGL